MEIFIQNIPLNADKNDVIRAVAPVLHDMPYTTFSNLPMNFAVHLIRDRYRRSRHIGRGIITLPYEEAGETFLMEYAHGPPWSQGQIYVRDNLIKFSPGKNAPKPRILEEIQRMPYVDPKAMEEQEEKGKKLREAYIPIRDIQFGWECRDGVVSIEWQQHVAGRGELTFELDRREIRVKIYELDRTLVVAVRFSEIDFSCSSSSRGEHALFLSLVTPPTFECELTRIEANEIRDSLNFQGSVYDVYPRVRLTELSPEHRPYVPYTSLALRLVFQDLDALQQFKKHCQTTNLHPPRNEFVKTATRSIFAPPIMQDVQTWLLHLPWPVAFQIESLLRSLSIEPSEILALRPSIETLIRHYGAQFAANILCHFAPRVKILGRDESSPDGNSRNAPSVKTCFEKCLVEYHRIHETTMKASQDQSDNYESLHVIITPTTMYLEGPFSERSNRVIRTFPADKQSSFLRVSFTDENRLQYRFDREVDGPGFIESHVGGKLRSSLTIAGRQFQFLAYSQSALKEHSVIFVKPFYHDGQRVDAASIIQSLGNFKDLAFDQRLIYCPARYGARISQAFTATDSSVEVEVEEIFPMNDIESKVGEKTWCHTDGVGTMSREIAKAVWEVLRAARSRHGNKKQYLPAPAAYQIRFMGSKGMLSIDYTLSGRAIGLRKSMIKFEAPNSRRIEIAQVFDKPGKYFLNRPLIIILEDLGVPYDVFEKYQDMIVEHTRASSQLLQSAATLLEAYGLGTSFHLPSIMLSLDKLGISSLNDEFYEMLMQYSINHVLRELKHHARIPIPGAWSLVGVADVHGFLEPEEIFACVKEPYGRAIYLEGPVLISRSPTIHPGDVRVVHAIGKPPKDSCFDKEPLRNTVVFSTRGDRPVPSCLGGGDLDGDTYNLIPLANLPDFRPPKCNQTAAEYTPAIRKELSRPSTMTDVADFVVDFINSDVLGIIATTWMVISDQSPDGIFDENCLKLSDLHSHAVDFQKSGQPVIVSQIPRYRFRTKPDWNAPETVAAGDNPNFYKSTKALGRLFRRIKLPAIYTEREHAEVQTRNLWDDEEDIIYMLDQLKLEDDYSECSDDDDPIYERLRARAFEFMPEESLTREEQEGIEQCFIRYVFELQVIAWAHSLSMKNMLTEEEVIVGTIVAKCSQPRKRKDLMSKMRERTDSLYNSIRDELSADEDRPFEDSIKRAWYGYEISRKLGEKFGARSFGWICLGEIFDNIRAIESDERSMF